MHHFIHDDFSNNLKKVFSRGIALFYSGYSKLLLSHIHTHSDGGNLMAFLSHAHTHTLHQEQFGIGTLQHADYQSQASKH